jgi:predicted NACHT family NTPase
MDMGIRFRMDAASKGRLPRDIAFVFVFLTWTLLHAAAQERQPGETIRSKPREDGPQVGHGDGPGIPAAPKLKERFQLQHELGVRALAFSPDGKTLATGCSDQGIHLWDAATGKELVVLQGRHGPVSSVAFSPDGKIIASSGDLTGIHLWDVAK